VCDGLEIADNAGKVVLVFRGERLNRGNSTTPDAEE